MNAFLIRLVIGASLVLAAAGLALPAHGLESIVTIVSGDSRHEFTVEIADNNETRSRGLMFRRALAPDAGMLFDYHVERRASFWMRNTLIPLDMIFIRANGEIVQVHANAIPHDETPIRSDVDVRFILEIPGGRAEELGISAGDFLEHPRVVDE